MELNFFTLNWIIRTTVTISCWTFSSLWCCWQTWCMQTLHFSVVYHRFAPCFSVLQLNHDIVWCSQSRSHCHFWRRCIPVVYHISFSCWSNYDVEGMTSHTNQPLILVVSHCNKTHGIWSMTPCNFDHWVVPSKLTEIFSLAAQI